MAPTIKIKRTVSITRARKEEVKVPQSLARATVEQESDGSVSEEDGPGLTPTEILRRHFESQFAPLEVPQSQKPRKGEKRIREDDTDEENEGQDCEGDELSYDNGSDDDDEVNSDEDKYDGFSDISEEDAQGVEKEGKGPEVVDYTGTRFTPTAVLPKPPKSELKAFMVCVPPSLQSHLLTIPHSPTKSPP